MFGLFNREPPLDEPSVEWLFDVYGWTLRNFGTDLFMDDTLLVLPTNRYFPGSESSVQGMAELILKQVKHYANISHWPTRVVDQNSCSLEQPAQLAITGALRGPEGVVDESVPDEQRLTITYDPALINSPEVMIASYAHTLAHYLGSMAEEEPPGDRDNWPHITEVLAVYMGFGVLFANSAFNVKISSCGSCQGPVADRESFLSQYDITYALAIFCVLKGISAGEVKRHLKSSLRPYFKLCLKDLKGRKDKLEKLRALA
ncbi:MAG: hypothetical protein OQK78_10840 [Gammaproteobacteria bacterium]|nr:hypothetical protein [Gammaproteobacteria bacterium]